MAGSCSCSTEEPGAAFDGASAGYRRILVVVIVLNAAMFVIETGAGLAAGSQALRADALDFLGDSLTYGLSLVVIGRPLVWRARAALIKGTSLGLLGLWVLGSTGYRVLVLGLPDDLVMGTVGLLALAVNLISAGLLARYRDGDANVRSVWLCSRNDAIGNLAVIAAAAGVAVSGTAWPDLAVAAVMAGLFLWSAVAILRRALAELRGIAEEDAPAAGRDAASD